MTTLLQLDSSAVLINRISWTSWAQIMPMSFDQPDNAARIRRLGVGDMVLPRDFRPGVVAAKLSRLLADESVAHRCRMTADKLDFAQALEQSCAVLEEVGMREKI